MKQRFPREMCRGHHPQQNFCNWYRNDEVNKQVCYKRGGAFSKTEEQCVSVDSFVDQEDFELPCPPIPVTPSTPAAVCVEKEPYDQEKYKCLNRDTHNFCKNQYNVQDGIRVCRKDFDKFCSMII